MNLLGPVSDIMTRNPITLGPEDNIKKVDLIFTQHKIHHIPVLDMGKLVGMISKSDFLFFRRGFQNESLDMMLEEIRLKNFKVKEIMTTGLAILDPNDHLDIALEVFKENLFHAIPVVEDDRLVGILTTFDVIKKLAEDRSIENTYKR